MRAIRFESLRWPAIGPVLALYGQPEFQVGLLAVIQAAKLIALHD